MEIRRVKPPARGSYRPYDPNQMSRAINAVFEDRMSVRKAAKKFCIPKSTLIDRCNGKVDIDVLKSGSQPMFSEEQEALLSGHLITMGEVGYGYSRQETINLASDFAVHLGLRTRDNPLSPTWFYGFLERCPQLKVKKPRSLDAARACSATRQTIDKYFVELDRIMSKSGLKDRPNMIFNIDEKGLSLEHKPPKIVAGKNYKAQAVTAGRSKTVTVIGAVGGSGQQIPPFFIFPGARMNSDLMEGATTGARGTVSQSGWSNTEIFNEYMKTHLLQYLPARSSTSPVLILYDGHKSHVSLSLIEWAKSENIILFVLPPHCSHLLQPLDVSCFGPFEVAWNACCHTYIRDSGGKVVSRVDACKLACKVYAATLTVPNIQAAFKRCGLIPFNASAIHDHQLAPSLTFARSAPADTCAPAPAQKDAEQFLEEKGGQILANVQTAKKPRNTLSKVVAGKAITEENIISQIRDHTEKYKPKPKATPIKAKATPNKAKATPTASKAKATPSSSGLSAPKKRRPETVESSSDEEDGETEKCIVCKRFSPDTSKHPYLLIVNWGKCDNCSGWVHLVFCSTVRVLRRGDPFLCPVCSN